MDTITVVYNVNYTIFWFWVLPFPHDSLALPNAFYLPTPAYFHYPGTNINTTTTHYEINNLKHDHVFTHPHLSCDQVT